MSTLLLDTDVFSYLFKDHPFAEVYRPLLKGHVLAISFMTVAELFQGAFRAGWGGKRIERLARGPVAGSCAESSHFQSGSPQKNALETGSSCVSHDGHDNPS